MMAIQVLKPVFMCCLLGSKGTASIKIREIDPSHVRETSFTAYW